MKDWSLIIFTIVMQGAVGIFIASWLLGMLRPDQQGRTRYLPWIGALGLVGVIASLTHLGSPELAYLTMRNVGRSWLSREILGVTLFGGAWLISAVLEYRNLGTPRVRDAWHAVTAICGLGLIFVMSMAYRFFVVPSWNTAATTAGFYATAGLIGTTAVLCGELFATRKQNDAKPAPQDLTWLAIAAMGFVGLQVLTIVTRGVYLGGAGPEAQATAAMLAGSWFPLLVIRLICLGIGGAVLMAWTMRQWAVGQKVARLVPVTVAAFVLVAAGELMDRVLFFASRVQIGQ